MVQQESPRLVSGGSSSYACAMQWLPSHAMGGRDTKDCSWLTLYCVCPAMKKLDSPALHLWAIFHHLSPSARPGKRFPLSQFDEAVSWCLNFCGHMSLALSCTGDMDR